MNQYLWIFIDLSPVSRTQTCCAQCGPFYHLVMVLVTGCIACVALLLLGATRIWPIQIRIREYDLDYLVLFKDLIRRTLDNDIVTNYFLTLCDNCLVP